MGRFSVALAFLALALACAAFSPPAVAAQDRPTAKPAASAPSAPLNLNTATQSQLETLPGIGAATAKRILEYRQKNGGFKKIEELMNVKGIGEKSFLKLKPHVTVAAEKTNQGEKQ
jgi:competence protein ComEA